MHNCRICGVELSEDNWYNKYIARYSYLCKKCDNEATSRSRLKLKIKVFKLLGDKCNRCGISDWRVLQIDHIKGNGYTERKKLGTTEQIMRRVLEHPEDYQLLCANCNWIKKYENNEISGVKHRLLTTIKIVEVVCKKKVLEIECNRFL